MKSTKVMLAPDIRPETIELLNRMAGAAPSGSWTPGELIELSWIDPVALGDLWAAAHRTEIARGRDLLRTPAADAARAVLKIGEKMEPAFRGSACRDYLALLVSEAQEESARTADGGATHTWEKARFVLRRCIELSFDGLRTVTRRLLAASEYFRMPHMAVALVRMGDPARVASVLEQLAAGLAHSPLLVEELRMAAALDLPAHLLLAELASLSQLAPAATTAEGRYRLSDCPPYPAFAEAGLRQAAERVRRIHAFELPYASDKAFTLQESAVIARLARVALDRDEVWLPPVLDEFFRKVSLAPTAAKTVPSQSVALTLGHAIEAFGRPRRSRRCARSSRAFAMPGSRNGCNAICAAPNAASPPGLRSRCGCRLVSRCRRRS